MWILKKIKKQKESIKNVVKNMRHKKDLDVLFNKKIIKYKIERIQSK